VPRSNTITLFGSKIPGSGFLTSYAFTGQILDPPTSLQYHRARWLDATLGQWLTSDSFFAFPEDLGVPYAYAHSNPVGFADVEGLFTLNEALSVVQTVGRITTAVMVTYDLSTTWGEYAGGDRSLGSALF